MSYPARFVLRSYDGEVLRYYTMDKPQFTIGRASDRDISLPHDKLISRRHLQVRLEQGAYIMVDEGSANGTYINGQLLATGQPHTLKNGDRVALGRHQIEVQLTNTAATTVKETPKQTETPEPLAVAAQMPLQVKQEVQEQPNVPVATSTPAVDLSTIARFQATTPMRAVSAAQLRFTVFLPQVVQAGDWFTLLIYAHPENALAAVHKDFALYLDGQSEQPPAIPAERQLLLQGTSISVIPECPGSTFNPKRLNFMWDAAWHRAELRFSVRKEWNAPNITGRLSFFAGPLLLGMVPLNLRVEAAGTNVDEAYTHVTVRAYKQIFASYSRDDTVIMLTCRNIYRALGFNALAQVDILRAGPIAEVALRQLIADAEVFQLFWSSNAAKTPYVMKEAEYALQLHRGADFLRPVYWDVPLAQIPPQLSGNSFTYLPRYAFAPRRQE